MEYKVKEFQKLLSFIMWNLAVLAYFCEIYITFSSKNLHCIINQGSGKDKYHKIKIKKKFLLSL